VIASGVGGLVEVVEHGVTGLLVDNTADSIAAAMRRLLDEPATRARLGTRGRHLVAGKFTVRAMLDGTVSVYNQVISCSKPLSPSSPAC
jgi:glycosyltransferase involved in cell wall biosynthesis